MRLAHSLAGPARLTALGIGLVTLAYAALVWDRRWIADDGLIVVRTVRQILEGNGPVYSTLERAEANTSALWTWLLAACAWLTGADPARLAVGLGGLLAIAGVAIALDAARRVQREHGHTGALVPAGALVVLAVFPFWDFATSGLEGGLAIGWLAAIWWLLVTLRADASRRRVIGFACAVGIGPLVRPDLGLATIVFLGAGWAIVRPPWRRALGLGFAAIALPLAYEVFRAGYYGTLVPLPALAKSATGSEWSRGFAYLLAFARPHLLHVPVAAIALAIALDRRALTPRSRIVVGAPIAAGALLAVFVVRVGGDFMHARLLLPSMLLIAMPAFVIPVRRATAPVLVALAAWALFTGIRFFTGAARVSRDERAGYVKFTRQDNPTTGEAYLEALPHFTANVESSLRSGRFLVWERGDRVAMNPAHAAPIVVAVGRLGLGGAVTPLDGVVIDTYGLANPLGARITRTQPGRTGHEKNLPWEWVLADFADPSVAMGFSPERIEAARRALACGALAELRASVREPLTAARFWANLTGAVRRTRLVIPADPVEAERTFCRP